MYLSLYVVRRKSLTDESESLYVNFKKGSEKHQIIEKTKVTMTTYYKVMYLHGVRQISKWIIYFNRFFYDQRRLNFINVYFINVKHV